MLGYKRINCFNVKLNGRIKRFVKLLTKITYKIEKRLLNVTVVSFNFTRAFHTLTDTDTNGVHGASRM